MAQVNPGSILDAALVLCAAAHAISALLLLVELRTRALPRAVVLPTVLVVSAGMTASVTGSVVLAVGATAVLGAAVLGTGPRLARFHSSGAALLASFVALVPTSLAWLLHFTLTTPVSDTTRVLMLAALPFSVILLPVMMVRTYENWEAIIRRDWARPRHARQGPRPGLPPRVCIHVPAHAEPPEVVIATLDSLARLQYSNFEVLVIDNNTLDETLWRPVEVHCAHLGSRFRFLHVEGTEGAKAGALNYALDHTDPACELIAVVDADYQVEPTFLADTVAFFDDPAMGFVQTPHAYRDWESNAFHRMCQWEYASFFVTGMVSRNERNAGITVGTMCVIRRDALEQVGRWATWCLTEDSELAVRIHAAGYSSVYLSQVYGRGVIPDTFAGYRKQRFRWTYGPVSELFRHYRLYLPRRWRQPSAMSRAQRIHHATHGLYGIATGLSLLALPLAFATAASMITHSERVPVPQPLWLAVTLLLVSDIAIRWITYRKLLHARFSEWIGGMLATAALAHVVMIANLTAMIGRAVPWQRTDKFRRRGRGLTALSAARQETILAAVCLLLGSVTVALVPAGIAGMLGIGILLRGAQYLAAPILTLIAEHSLRREPTHITDAGELAIEPSHRLAETGHSGSRTLPDS